MKAKLRHVCLHCHSSPLRGHGLWEVWRSDGCIGVGTLRIGGSHAFRKRGRFLRPNPSSIVRAYLLWRFRAAICQRGRFQAADYPRPFGGAQKASARGPMIEPPFKRRFTLPLLAFLLTLHLARISRAEPVTICPGAAWADDRGRLIQA